MHDIRQGTCPLCGHNEIIEAEPHARAEGADTRVQLASASVGRRGVLLSFTCRSCGYTQLFAESPRDIAVRPELQTRLIVGPVPSPFR